VEGSELPPGHNNGATERSFEWRPTRRPAVVSPLVTTQAPVNGFPARWHGTGFGPAAAVREVSRREIEGETDATSVFSKLALRLFLGERCLRDTDSMSMGVSLEVRAPFTDHTFLKA